MRIIEIEVSNNLKRSAVFTLTPETKEDLDVLDQLSHTLEISYRVKGKQELRGRLEGLERLGEQKTK